VSAIRALGRFLFAILYFFLARLLASHGAHGLVAEDWAPLTEQAMLVFLLLLGYAGLGFSMEQQLKPVSAQGLAIRPGWLSEIGLGVAFGWGAALACVLVLVVFGGIAWHFTFHWVSLGWLAVDAAYFALAALAAQIAYRGYPFQCAIRAFGELPAALVLAVLCGIFRARLPGAGTSSMAVSVVLGLLLAMAYLRTRALWLAWGFEFGWMGSQALLFGLPVDGATSHSQVVQGEPLGSFSLSGANFGLNGSWLAFCALLLTMPFVYRATRELSFLYNAPVLEPAGIPVDLDAAARSQHEVATRLAVPEVKPLVQILPAGSLPPAAAVEKDGREPDGAGGAA
jgi:hypothetical protein